MPKGICVRTSSHSQGTRINKSLEKCIKNLRKHVAVGIRKDFRSTDKRSQKFWFQKIQFTKQ